MKKPSRKEQREELRDIYRRAFEDCLKVINGTENFDRTVPGAIELRLKAMTGEVATYRALVNMGKQGTPEERREVTAQFNDEIKQIKRGFDLLGLDFEKWKDSHGG